MLNNNVKTVDWRNQSSQYFIVAICGTLMLGCQLIYTNFQYIRGYVAPLTCGHKLFLNERELLNTWKTTYGLDQGLVSEKIILNEDYTYTQVFENGMENESTWQLIYDDLDGPKIQLNDGVYYFEANDFGQIISLGETELKRRLTPQAIDMLQYENANGLIDHSKFTISYPESGYIYLYPRICNGEFVLQGMVDFFIDLDGTGSEGPEYFIIDGL